MVTRSERVMKIGVYVALTALAAFVVYHVVRTATLERPPVPPRDLAPMIGAQPIELPLPAALAGFSVERPPEMGGGTIAPLAAIEAGEVVFLNFWASWCEPCVAELPSMIRLEQRFADRPFRMVAVSYDEGWPQIKRFFDTLFKGMPGQLEVYRDPREDDAKMMRTAFGTEKLPETYVIKDGQIISRFVNARDWLDPAIVMYFEGLLKP